MGGPDVNAQRTNLDQDGYFTVQGVLGREQISNLRAVCDRYFRDTGNQIMPARDFLAIPELAVIPFHPAVVEALKSVLGPEYVTIPEYTMQTERFGGWHTDAQTERHADYLYRPDYLQIQCGIYLQDNVPGLGGGLDVAPKSHLEVVAIGSPSSVFRRLVRRGSYLHARSFRSPLKLETWSGSISGLFIARLSAVARYRRLRSTQFFGLPQPVRSWQKHT